MHERESWVSPLQFCIRVHVREKFDRNDPRIDPLLPTSCGDTPVDVCQQRYSNRPAASEGAETSGFADPVEGGVPIAAIQSGMSHWGTLGGVVFSAKASATSRIVMSSVMPLAWKSSSLPPEPYRQVRRL